jgi:hypothetical protein
MGAIVQDRYGDVRVLRHERLRVPRSEVMRTRPKRAGCCRVVARTMDP